MSSAETTYVAFVVIAFVVFCGGLIYGMTATKDRSKR